MYIVLFWSFKYIEMLITKKNHLHFCMILTVCVASICNFLLIQNICACFNKWGFPLKRNPLEKDISVFFGNIGNPHHLWQLSFRIMEPSKVGGIMCQVTYGSCTVPAGILCILKMAGKLLQICKLCFPVRK